jgi:hypothetical protein
LYIHECQEYINGNVRIERKRQIFCTAKQERCGDGVVQEDKESCDPKALAWQNRADGKTCDASCKIVEPAKVNPVCNSTYNNQTKYTTTSAVWLSSSDDLCSK